MNSNLLTINDLCQELGIGKNSAYNLIKTKEIKSFKIGRNITIRREDLDDFIYKKANS